MVNVQLCHLPSFAFTFQLLGIISTPKLAVHTSLILKIFSGSFNQFILLIYSCPLCHLPFAINLILNLSNNILYLVI